MSDSTVTAAICTDVACINLRGDATDAKFCKAVEGALGQPLPLEPNTTTRGAHCVYWLGPDEWLISTGRGKREQVLVRLADSLSGLHVAVNDVTGGNVVLQLKGAQTRNLLAKGCTLDLHPSEFAVGSCAQSGLAKANVLLGLADDAPTFDVIVRRSFADYTVKWLQHAGREYGIVFR